MAERPEMPEVSFPVTDVQAELRRLRDYGHWLSDQAVAVRHVIDQVVAHCPHTSARTWPLLNHGRRVGFQCLACGTRGEREP